MKQVISKATRAARQVQQQTPSTGSSSSRRTSTTYTTPSGMPSGRRTSQTTSARVPGGQRDLHSMAAGTMRRFNDPQAFYNLAQSGQSVLVSTYESEAQVRANNPRFDQARQQGQDYFNSLGLRLEFAFNVDTTQGASDPNVAYALQTARANGIDMSVVDASFLRSNQETPEADAAYLQQTAAAQYGMGVTHMGVTHTLNPAGSGGAPDAAALQSNFAPYYAPTSTTSAPYGLPFESSPRGGGEILSGRVRQDVGYTSFESTHPEDEEEMTAYPANPNYTGSYGNNNGGGYGG